MGTTPTTENGAAETANKIIRTLVDAGINTAKVLSIAEVPFLGWPVISQVYSFVLGKIGDQIYKAFSEYSTFVIIDAQTQAEKKAYLAAIDAVKKAQASGDQYEIGKAEKDFKDSLAKLIHFDGSTRT